MNISEDEGFWEDAASFIRSEEPVSPNDLDNKIADLETKQDAIAIDQQTLEQLIELASNHRDYASYDNNSTPYITKGGILDKGTRFYHCVFIGADYHIYSGVFSVTSNGVRFFGNQYMLHRYQRNLTLELKRQKEQQAQIERTRQSLETAEKSADLPDEAIQTVLRSRMNELHAGYKNLTKPFITKRDRIGRTDVYKMELLGEDYSRYTAYGIVRDGYVSVTDNPDDILNQYTGLRVLNNITFEQIRIYILAGLALILTLAFVAALLTSTNTTAVQPILSLLSVLVGYIAGRGRDSQ